MNNLLVLEHLNKTFGKGNGRVQAVNDLSMAVQEGEIFGFLGPNGAGKTTTISMISGLLRPDSGEVFFKGRPFTHNGEDLRAHVGVCPQSIILWDKLTCLENLVFMGEMYGVPLGQARQRGEELLAALGLAEQQNKLAATLSGGMQRRLNLALALVHAPELLILDEPEAGLDPQARVMVREYIRAWAQERRGRTVIFTTHNMDEAERLVDRVAIVDRGRLLVVDSPETLKRQYGGGEVLEVTLPAGLQMLEKIPGWLSSIGAQVCLNDGVLEVRARNAVEVLPAVLQILRQKGVEPAEIRLRGNTLEDVFIALTGRRLRE